MILVTMQNLEKKNDNKTCLVSIILISCRSIWQFIKISKPQKHLIKRCCTFFFYFLHYASQTLLLQHPPVSLCPLQRDLWKPAHGHAFVVKVVLADVHDGDLLGDVFDGGGVGEGRAYQLCHPFYCVGLGNQD